MLPSLSLRSTITPRPATVLVTTSSLIELKPRWASSMATYHSHRIDRWPSFQFKVSQPSQSIGSALDASTLSRTKLHVAHAGLSPLLQVWRVPSATNLENFLSSLNNNLLTVTIVTTVAMEVANNKLFAITKTRNQWARVSIHTLQETVHANIAVTLVMISTLVLRTQLSTLHTMTLTKCTLPSLNTFLVSLSAHLRQHSTFTRVEFSTTQPAVTNTITQLMWLDTVHLVKLTTGSWEIHGAKAGESQATWNLRSRQLATVFAVSRCGQATLSLTEVAVTI